MSFIDNSFNECSLRKILIVLYMTMEFNIVFKDNKDYLFYLHITFILKTMYFRF